MKALPNLLNPGLAGIAAAAAAGAAGYRLLKFWKSRFGFKNGDTSMNMASSEAFPFGSMHSSEAGHISLRSVAIRGEIEGLFFGWQIIQEYKNKTDHPLEIIYTFPLGWDAALLGMSAKIGEKELVGVVVEKKEAEEKYEAAVAKGDSAILVQKSGDGLYTANLGNIGAGETVSVRLDCARLLSWGPDGVRLSIPTVVGERYGDPFGPGGLAPHESVKPSAAANYPFTVDLRIRGDLAGGDVRCLSGGAQIMREGNETLVRLDHGAVMDRDFVLFMPGAGAASQAYCVPDGEKFMLAASFLPKMADMRPSAIGLKILVDCSGSMSGSSIAEAKKGLGKVLGLLEERDYLSYSRFGSYCRHESKRLERCGKDALKKFSRAIEATDADMGGTEMEGALKSTFVDIKNPAAEEVPAMVLLITDGDVWNTQNIVAAAKNSGQRIFVIGVGYAPGENVLRTMAEQTGGACELVTPEESIAEAIVRMFQRMRGTIAKNIKIDWHGETLWQSALPKSIYDGETVHAFALVQKRPEAAPTLRWTAEGHEMEARAESLADSGNTDLCRLGRWRQLGECEKKKATELALKYQLISPFTSLVLVYDREEKIDAPLEVEQVPQMRAHGHGSYLAGAASLGIPGNVPQCLWSKRSFFEEDGLSSIMHFCELDAKADDTSASLDAAQFYALWLRQIPGGSLGQFASSLEAGFAAAVEKVAEIAQNLGVAEEAVWAVLLRAVEEKLAGEGAIETSRHSRRMIDAALKNFSSTDIALITEEVIEKFDLV